MAALHPDKTGDPALRPRRLDIVGTQRQRHAVRVKCDQPLGDVDLFQRHLHRFGLVERGGDVDRPPLRADMPGPQPREIGMHRVARLGLRRAGIGEVELAQLVAEAAAQLDRHVVMPVPHRRGFKGGLRDLLGRLRQRGCAQKRCESGSGGETAQHVVTPLHLSA